MKIRVTATNKHSLMFLWWQLHSNMLMVLVIQLSQFIINNIYSHKNSTSLSFSKSNHRHHIWCCKMNSLSPPTPCIFYTKKLPKFRRRNTIIFSSSKQQISISTSTTVKAPYTVSFKTQRACKLGISRYPDFEYDAEGGIGTGFGSKVAAENTHDNVLLVSFDIETLYIPPLTSSTTKFLGLPLPPFLKIDIVPEAFQGSIDQQSGKVDLEFKAKFLFSTGSLYKAPPLLVKTVLTSEESKGDMKSGRGKRLDGEGKCRLVGVARVDPIDDFLMNSFLGLPTECLADLNAVISISSSS